MNSLRAQFVASLTCIAMLCTTTANATTYFAGVIVDGNNQPLAGATVQAGHVTVPILGTFVADGQATTNAQGEYAITTLGAGDGTGNYTLVASLAGHVSEVYPNTECLPEQPCPGPYPLSYAVPDFSANFQLLQAGSISGRVTRTDTNAGVPNAFIAYSIGDSYFGHVYADGSGNFAISGALPGMYQFTVSQSDDDSLLAQVYAGHDYDLTMAQPDGDNLTLNEGADLTDIDFQMHVGAIISGTITSAIDGDLLQSTISIRRLTPVSSGDGFIPTAYSGSYMSPPWGQYRTPGLLPGTFHIQLNAGNYAPQFYADAPTEDAAQTITITGSESIGGIDGHLTPLQTIAGTVTDAESHLPIAGVIVHAGPILPFLLDDSADAPTDADGNYLLQEIGPSTSFPYYIWVSQVPGYVDTFYPNVTGTCCALAPPGAQSVTVSYGDHLTGYDFSLAKGATMSGRVYDPDTGFTVTSNGYISVYRQGVSQEVESVSLTAVTFTLDAVPTGSYYISVTALGRTVYYPDFDCSGGCSINDAPAQQLTAPQHYELDFAIPHLDLVFRGSFD